MSLLRLSICTRFWTVVLLSLWSTFQRAKRRTTKRFYLALTLHPRRILASCWNSFWTLLPTKPWTFLFGSTCSRKSTWWTFILKSFKNFDWWTNMTVSQLFFFSKKILGIDIVFFFKTKKRPDLNLLVLLKFKQFWSRKCKRGEKSRMSSKKFGILMPTDL